jgi:hypothetical protein
MMHLIRTIIRETLLLEEVYGAQATVYHGTKTDPNFLIGTLLKNKFRPGEGAGSMYGKGLYTVYDFLGTKTSKGVYGDYVIKFKVNLYGYIIFDPDVALKVYKKPLTPAEQAEEVGYSDTVINALSNVSLPRSGVFTSESALSVYKSIQHYVKGLVFTGENDGRVAVVYDPTTAVPMAWKQVTKKGRGQKTNANNPWVPVDRTLLLAPTDRPDVSAREGRPAQQSALRRSALGDFEVEKWSNISILRRLEKLPHDQRIVNGDLDFEGDTLITSLPSGLTVNGSLNLSNTPIKSLPSDLQVNGQLGLSGSRIESLPAGLNVRWNLSLSNTPIASLPQGLKVGGFLFLSDTPVTSLPDDLQVTYTIVGLDRKYWNSVPQHLKGKLE